MKRRYQNAFDQLKTSEQLEENIIRTCMDPEPERTPRLRRRPVRLAPVLIAALIGTAVLGVSAYAITAGFRRQADTYFTQNGGNTELFSTDEDEARIYEDYYYELGLSATSSGTTVNLHGYISDNKNVYLFGSIAVPEDVTLDYDDPDTSYEYEFSNAVFDLGLNEGPLVFIPEFSFLPYDETVPNQREFVCKMIYGLNDFDWSRLKSITLTDFERTPATREEIADPDFYEPIVFGTWEFTDLSLTATHQPISLISEPTTVSWYHAPQDRIFEITYSEITISLFGIQLMELENKDSRSITNYCSIIMKDGTVYEHMNENPDNILVDLSQVDYVKLGDQIFTLPEEAAIPSGNAATPAS
ncbi:MAG: DUF4179 domain-containing protein [Ruminococcus sp.]|nr:DUF4179 domain-containing protein [Ruminococcus sp.]